MDLPVSIEHSEPGDPHLPWLLQEAELIPGPSLKPAFLCPCSLLACSCSLGPGSQPSGFLGAPVVKNIPAMQEMQAWSLGQEETLEEGNGNHSSILAWEIPWTEELSGLQCMGSQQVDMTERLNNTKPALTQCSVGIWSTRSTGTCSEKGAELPPSSRSW